MAKYRIYLSEGRQIDLDAHSHQAFIAEKAVLTRVDFFNEAGHTVASFTAAALHGYSRTDSLAAQKDKVPNV